MGILALAADERVVEVEISDDMPQRAVNGWSADKCAARLVPTLIKCDL